MKAGKKAPPFSHLRKNLSLSIHLLQYRQTFRRRSKIPIEHIEEDRIEDEITRYMLHEAPRNRGVARSTRKTWFFCWQIHTKTLHFSPNQFSKRYGEEGDRYYRADLHHGQVTISQA